MSEALALTAAHEAGHAVAALALGAEVEALWVEAVGEGYGGEVALAWWNRPRGADPGRYAPAHAVVGLAGPVAMALAQEAQGEPGPGRICGDDLDNVRRLFALRPDLDRQAFERAVRAWLARPEVWGAVLRVARRVVVGFQADGVTRVELPGRVVAGLVRTLPPPPAVGLVA